MEETLVIKIRKSTLETGSAEDVYKEAKNYLDNKPSELFYTLKERLTKHLLENKKIETQERIKILEAICNKKGCFSSVDIHSIVLKDLHISIRTIRRTLNLFVNSGILVRIKKEDLLFDPFYYEINKDASN